MYKASDILSGKSTTICYVNAMTFCPSIHSMDRNFTEDFIERTRIARERKFSSQDAIAKALGITAASYQKYETRTPLPHRYIFDFCKKTGTDIFWLFTGKHTRRNVQTEESEIFYKRYLLLDSNRKSIVDDMLVAAEAREGGQGNGADGNGKRIVS